MTGWGQTGPLAHAAGHDINYIALTGALHAIGPPDEPPVPPLNLVGDFGGGALYLAFGIAGRAATSASAPASGQVVDAAMVDGAASLMTMFYGLRAHGRWSDERGANLLDGGGAVLRHLRAPTAGYVASARSSRSSTPPCSTARPVDDADFATQTDRAAGRR